MKVLLLIVLCCAWLMAGITALRWLWDSDEVRVKDVPLILVSLAIAPFLFILGFFERYGDRVLWRKQGERQ